MKRILALCLLLSGCGEESQLRSRLSWEWEQEKKMQAEFDAARVAWSNEAANLSAQLAAATARELGLRAQLDATVTNIAAVQANAQALVAARDIQIQRLQNGMAQQARNIQMQVAPVTMPEAAVVRTRPQPTPVPAVRQPTKAETSFGAAKAPTSTRGVWVGDHWEYPSNVHGMKHKKSDGDR